MPILQLPPNPARNESNDQPGGTPPSDHAGLSAKPIKLRIGRFGELEEHELIHLIDSLDDERSRARFRESVYISIIIWTVIGWFLFYGPRVLWHQPVLRDPIAMMKQHDREQLIDLNVPKAPKIKPPAPVVNHKLAQQLQKQAQEAPRTLQPPIPQPAAPPPPPEVAHNTSPPVPQPSIPLPSAPRPAPSVSLPSAPTPSPAIAQNSQSPHSAMQDAMRGGLRGRNGADIGAPGTAAGPLQAGTQILSDTGDWDYTAYMRRLHNDIQRNWDPLIPAEVQPPLMKKGIVGIRFIILRDGSISGPGPGGQPVLETNSGDVALDRAAWGAIIGEGQYPPLPKEYKGQQLELRVGFFYNTPIN